MLSVIDFGLAVPVVVQQHEARVSMVGADKDGTASTSPLQRDLSDKWLANAMDDQTNAPPIPRPSDSGHWREWEPRQHNPSLRTDSNDSPEPSNPRPAPLNTDLNADLLDPNANSPSPSPQPRSGSGPSSPSPTNQAPTNEPDPLSPLSPHDDSHTPNPLLFDSSPLRPDPTQDDNVDLNFRPQSSSQKFETDLMSTTTRVDLLPGGSSQPASSSPQRHVSPPANSPGSPQDHDVPPPPNLGDNLSSDSYSLSSGSMTDSETTGEYHYPSPPDLSTDGSHPPTPGPIDNNPLPASPLSPGSSTEPNPPPRAKRPPPEENEAESILSKIAKGDFKRRFSGTGALNAAQGPPPEPKEIGIA